MQAAPNVLLRHLKHSPVTESHEEGSSSFMLPEQLHLLHDSPETEEVRVSFFLKGNPKLLGSLLFTLNLRLTEITGGARLAPATVISGKTVATDVFTVFTNLTGSCKADEK